MGTFGKSLSRELGKNTGKVISNAVFGNKWSTPHRVGASVKIAEIRADKAKSQADAIVSKAEMELSIARRKMNVEALGEISDLSFSNNVDQIYDVLTKLWSIAQNHDSNGGNSGLKSAAISKIEDGIFKLKRLGANEEADYFQTKLTAAENVKKKETRNDTIFYIVAAVAALLLWLYMTKFMKSLF